MLGLAYHIEGNDILEGDLAGAVALDEDLVNDLGTTSRGQTQDKRLLLSRIERLDAAWGKVISRGFIEVRSAILRWGSTY